jgi:hypothetical protein
MAQEIKFKTGDEQDALTGWRRWIRFRPGDRAQIKKGYRRRVRRWAQKMLRRELQAAD